MWTIHDVLTLLRNQQGAMLDRKSAEVLSAFLQGFALATKQGEGSADQEFLLNFNEWVRKRLHCESSTQGWAKIISFQATDEADEWRMFWKLYDEYMAKHRGRRSAESMQERTRAV